MTRRTGRNGGRRLLWSTLAAGVSVLAIGCTSVPDAPWGRNSKPREYRTAEKPSWLASLFRRVEPKPPQTMDEWMDLESPKP